MINYDRLTWMVLIGILFSGALIAIAEVESCSECDNRFVNVAGDTMTGTLNITGANSKDNSTRVGDGSDWWRVGVYDIGLGAGNTVNLEATQNAIMTFGNGTVIDPNIYFAPSNTSAEQRPAFWFVGWDSSGPLTGGALLGILPNKNADQITLWNLGANNLALFSTNISLANKLFDTLVVTTQGSSEIELVTVGNIDLGLRPDQDLVMDPIGYVQIFQNGTWKVQITPWDIFFYDDIKPFNNVSYDLGGVNYAWRNLYVQTVYEGSAGAINAGVREFMDLDLHNKDVEALKESFPEEIKDTYNIREWNQKVMTFNNDTDYYEMNVSWNYVPKANETIRIERRSELVDDDYISTAVAGEEEVIFEKTFLDVFSELRWTQTVLQQVMTETCIRDHTYSWCS